MEGGCEGERGRDEKREGERGEEEGAEREGEEREISSPHTAKA